MDDIRIRSITNGFIVDISPSDFVRNDRLSQEEFYATKEELIKAIPDLITKAIENYSMDILKQANKSA